MEVTIVEFTELKNTDGMMASCIISISEGNKKIFFTGSTIWIEEDDMLNLQLPNGVYLSEELEPEVMSKLRAAKARSHLKSV